MANVLILYGTTYGQTAKVAQHLARTLESHGHRVTCSAVAAHTPPATCPRHRNNTRSILMAGLTPDLLTTLSDSAALRTLFSTLGYGAQTQATYSARTLDWPDNVAVDLHCRGVQTVLVRRRS